MSAGDGFLYHPLNHLKLFGTGYVFLGLLGRDLVTGLI